jgi:hypothetical protein
MPINQPAPQRLQCGLVLFQRKYDIDEMLSEMMAFGMKIARNQI